MDSLGQELGPLWRSWMGLYNLHVSQRKETCWSWNLSSVSVVQTFPCVQHLKRHCGPESKESFCWKVYTFFCLMFTFCIDLQQENDSLIERNPGCLNTSSSFASCIRVLHFWLGKEQRLNKSLRGCSMSGDTPIQLLLLFLFAVKHRRAGRSHLRMCARQRDEDRKEGSASYMHVSVCVVRG